MWHCRTPKCLRIYIWIYLKRDSMLRGQSFWVLLNRKLLDAENDWIYFNFRSLTYVLLGIGPFHIATAYQKTCGKIISDVNSYKMKRSNVRNQFQIQISIKYGGKFSADILFKFLCFYRQLIISSVSYQNWVLFSINKLIFVDRRNKTRREANI